MDKKKSYYRQSGRSGSYYGSKDRQKESAGKGGVKMMAFVLLLAFSVLLRFSSSGPLYELKTNVSNLLRTDTDYADAVTTFGESITKEGGIDQRLDAVLTFGKDILGIPEPAQNVFEETGPDDAQNGDEADGGAKGTDLQSAGGFSGLSLTQEEIDSGIFMQEPGLYMPELKEPSHEELFFRSLELEEESDDTPNEDFLIPYPDNASYDAPELPFQYKTPLSGTETSQFGYRIHPVSGNTTFHYGLDIAESTGKRINAFAAGKVLNTGSNSVYGNYVRIEHEGGFITFYGHMDKISVKEGASVKLGQKIGTVGNTGVSTGSHLHFEVRQGAVCLNPKHYI